MNERADRKDRLKIIKEHFAGNYEVQLHVMLIEVLIDIEWQLSDIGNSLSNTDDLSDIVDQLRLLVKKE